MTCTPGWRRSQSAKSAASRPRSTSTGRCPSVRSISTVPYWWPRGGRGATRTRRRRGRPPGRPVDPAAPDPPGDVGTGCAPGSTPDCIAGTAIPAPVGGLRSAPCRRPDRSITTGDSCGSRTRQQHSPATAREHHPDPAVCITGSGPEPGSWLTLVELFGSHSAFSRGHQPQGERAGGRHRPLKVQPIPSTNPADAGKSNDWSRRSPPSCCGPAHFATLFGTFSWCLRRASGRPIGCSASTKPLADGSAPIVRIVFRCHSSEFCQQRSKTDPLAAFEI